ncbi:uroporphyrinogen-III synthase [Paenibacillus sp. 7124]|uniref:Uroporphyrinogen-III synthase n=1 Tax=Paenibacillus apii TaxID=1850370 RepID=A0A6M1PGA8_9BACL|nr:uroporphyrinogen-III synthase [Paenibacillus apii]NGM82216.1 uroporphyrinogen-III synthase [Paenibacillus apii]NJJ39353.1 uroporphyrinogen-III synthase [Paenibacillus apii]
MADQLKGVTIALAGPRKSEELAKLISNMGGTALLRPAQGTVFLDGEELRRELEEWTSNPPDWSILTTGMGLDALYQVAGDMGIQERFQEVLAGSMIAARGYKTVNALKKRGLVPNVRDDDGSTSGLIRGLEAFDLRGKTAVLQLHGDPAPRLNAWLKEAGAEVREVLPYRHMPPEQADLERLLTEITEAKVDAVTFTSAPQIRFLAEYADSRGMRQAMLDAFEAGVLAVAVGRITADALKEAGIRRIVMPEQERMGSMIVELGRYLAANR